MLMIDDNTEREVNKTISLFESGQRAKAPPFFYTRLKTRMQKRSSKSAIIAYSPRIRFSLAMAAILMLILINIYSLWRSSSLTSALLKKEQLTSFSKEYKLTYNQYMIGVDNGLY